MRARVAGALIGVVFGLALTFSGMTSPEVIREALLFEDFYLYGLFASAVATATLGTWLLRRRGGRAVLTGQPIGWTPERVRRRHIEGAALFGLGWGVTGACPGPIATQLGQGIAWALPLAAGTALGVWLYMRREALETEPACEPAPAPAEVAAAPPAPRDAREPVAAG